MVDSTRLASNQLRDDVAIGRYSTLFEQYFDLLLQNVLEHGGQPLIFAGDGLLSGWSCANGLPRERALWAAAQCANCILLNKTIQDLTARPIQTHAILAFGPCKIEEISTSRYLTYITVGKGLSDLQEATRALRKAPKETKDEAVEHLFLSAGACPIVQGLRADVKTYRDCERPDREFGILIELYEELRSSPLPLEPMTESAVSRLYDHWPRAQRSTIGVIIDEPDLLNWGADMRGVTAVFVNLSDLNSAVAELKDIKNGLEKVVQAAIPFVGRHDGAIHQLRVDDAGVSLLVMFGTLKFSRYDDAARGVRMALDLLDALSSIGCPRSSIGVATTDKALCELIGNDKYRSYMVHGDVINRASRLAGLEQGVALCDVETEAVCSRAGDLRFERYYRRKVKGPSLPITVLRPLRREEPEASIPMVGREKERIALQLALEVAARRQKASVVLLEGQPGVGKSRLLFDFQQRICSDAKLKHEEVQILTSSANEIEQQVPYHGWRAIYEQLFGIDIADSYDTEACQKKVLKKLRPEQCEQRSLLNAVLPVGFPDSPNILRLSPKQREATRLDLLLSLLRDRANNVTCAIVIDDAQWLDWASWELAHRVAAELKNLCLILSFVREALNDWTAVYDIVVDAKEQADHVSERHKKLAEHDSDNVNPECNAGALAGEYFGDLDSEDHGRFLGYMGHGIVSAEFERAAIEAAKKAETQALRYQEGAKRLAAEAETEGKAGREANSKRLAQQAEEERKKAACKIRKGQVTEPIETKGCWHVIKTKVEKPDNRFCVQGLQSIDEPTDAELEELIFQRGGLRMRLKKLSKPEQRELICRRLDVKRADEKVITQIVKLANGEPFHCIELAQTLKDQGMLRFAEEGCDLVDPDSASNLELPTTLGKAIQGRIDRLGPGPKYTLKVASAAGARFPKSLLIDMDPSAKDILDSGRLYGLLEVDSKRTDEMELCVFRHKMILDAAYDLWDPRTRENAHVQIAEWYQKNSYSNQSPNNALLAYHYKKAGKPYRASDYLTRESKRLFKLGLAQQSVMTGLEAAALLGIELPNDPTSIEKAWNCERERVVALLEKGQTDKPDPRPLGEENVIHVLEVLLTVGPFAFQSEKLLLFNLINETAMRFALERDAEDATAAEVYSMYSIVVALFGNPKEGIEWSRRALKLVPDKREKRYGRIAFVNGWFHNHWIAPLKTSIEQYRSGAQAALPHGDLDLLDQIFRCFNLAAEVIFRAAAGQPLPDVMQSAHQNLFEIDEQVMNASYHVKLELQLAKAFAGKTNGPYELTDEQCDHQKDIASILDTELSNQKGQYLVSLVKLHAIFGDWKGARKWAKELFKRELRPCISGQIAQCELEQFYGLASLAEAAFGDDENTQKLRTLKSEGRYCEGQLRRWHRDFCRWNNLNWETHPTMFGHKADLLAGILECASGEPEKAAELLTRSAQSAMAKPNEHYLHDAGLACEFLARCYRKAGKESEAWDALEKALNHYGRWGAIKKRDLLKNEFAMAKT